MTNEIIFILYIAILGIINLAALRIGKEALIGFIVTQAILSNLFILKEITLFNLCATASDALAIGSILSLNLLQEYFGRNYAYKAIKISFLCLISYCIFSILHLLYIPAPNNIYQPYFSAILLQSPRIIISSGIVYVIVDTLDSFLYGFLKQKFNNKYLLLRNWITALTTQLLDTILFSFLGLYKATTELSNLNLILEIIITAYIIKVISIFLITPFIAFSKKFYAKS